MKVRAAIWLLPVAFLLHDGEEIATMPTWVARNRVALDRIAELGDAAAWTVANLPATTGEVAVAVAFELLLILAATGALALRLRRGPALHFYSAVLGALLLHVVTHVAQAIVFRGYTPGVVSAVVVIPPASIALYGTLIRAGLLTGRSALLTAGAGAVAVLPVVVLAHQVGRLLA